MTPEATEAVCDKILDGFGEQMRMESLKITPNAILAIKDIIGEDAPKGTGFRISVEGGDDDEMSER